MEIDSISDVLVFVTVVTEGTFTAAAKKLQLTTSNVSRRVTRL